MSERFLDKLFQAFEDTAVEQQQAALIVTPADGDDMTWQTQDKTLNLAEVAKRITQIERQNERLQNEMAGLAAQVVELRERMDRNEADS